MQDVIAAGQLRGVSGRGRQKAVSVGFANDKWQNAGGLRFDVVAGLTAASVVLPKAMAYARSAIERFDQLRRDAGA